MKLFYSLLVHGAWIAAWLVPLYAFFFVIYFLIGLPLRRQERSRFFLDLIETGMKQGDSLERTVISISHSRDETLGVPFHLLASHLSAGWKFIPALERVPGLVPPQMTAMLKVGEEIGDVRKVLPACRTYLKDGSSQLQSSHHYLIVLAFVLIPVMPALFWAMSVFIVPRLNMVFADLLEGEAVTQMPMFGGAVIIAQIQLVMALLFYVGAICYIGGPRMLSWLQAGLSVPSFDWFLYRIPWRRKRMQRDFSAMLAVLLDAEVPEDRAISLAAECTANRIFIHRAQAVALRLRQGHKLTEALEKLDETGEFRWRLTNAMHAGRNFFSAVAGWLESLDAKAFQQEQAAAQSVTTALVLLNGAMVTMFAVFVLGSISKIFEMATLW